MRQMLRRTAITVAGFTLLIVGIALIPLPGPGLLVIAGALAILATEYDWAKRALQSVKARIDRLRRRDTTS